MDKTISRFILQILFFGGVAFGLHILILNFLNLPLFNDKIILAYGINVVLAIVVFATLFNFREKLKNQLGFLFLGGSAIKFALFFLLFFFSYKQDDVISGTEFSAFFVPYLLTLIIEVFNLSKWLNKIE